MKRSIELKAVHKILQKYIDGTMNGDFQSIRDIFHPNALMCGYMNGHLATGSPEPFFQDVEHGPKQKNTESTYSGQIMSVLVTGNTAVGVVVEDGISVGQPEGNRLTLDIVNNFQLLKIDGCWLICSKLFHHDPIIE